MPGHDLRTWVCGNLVDPRRSGCQEILAKRPWQVGRVLNRQKQDFLEETSDQGCGAGCFLKKKKELKK